VTGFPDAGAALCPRGIFFRVFPWCGFRLLPHCLLTRGTRSSLCHWSVFIAGFFSWSFLPPGIPRDRGAVPVLLPRTPPRVGAVYSREPDLFSTLPSGAFFLCSSGFVGTVSPGTFCIAAFPRFACQSFSYDTDGLPLFFFFFFFRPPGHNPTFLFFPALLGQTPGSPGAFWGVRCFPILVYASGSPLAASPERWRFGRRDLASAVLFPF